MALPDRDQVNSAVEAPESRAWRGLSWSAWMPLSAAHPLALGQLPESPGFFRLRRVGRSCPFHVDYAQEGVRQRIERLSRQSSLRQPPVAKDDLANLLWNDPQRAGRRFQVSAARRVPGSDPQREIRLLRQSLALSLGAEEAAKGT